ncbi:MAG: 50S ribosomal protein L11 methyltransferase [Verrucomicrobiota bacterium]
MWVWEKLSAANWLDAWEERFHGNPNLVIHVLKGGKTLRVEVFCESREEGERIARRFGGRVKELKKDDWQKPVEVPPPLKIRDRFVVTQEAGTKALKAMADEFSGREILSIPPEMAFGTGDHATTSTCLRFLVDVAKQGKSEWSCADLGCGSGLLAIAAGKLGAEPIFACDFDPFAVKVTERNCERNGVEGVEVKEIDVLKWKPREKYDVVMANIFSTVLIQAFPVLSKVVKPGGDLILSGILASQAWEVFEEAARHGFGFPKVVKKGKWVTARGGWMRDLEG